MFHHAFKDSHLRVTNSSYDVFLLPFERDK